MESHWKDPVAFFVVFLSAFLVICNEIVGNGVKYVYNEKGYTELQI